MSFEKPDAGELITATAESVLGILDRRGTPLHPHLQREMLVSACDLLERALMLHQVPVYPSGVPVPLKSRPE